MDSQNLLASLPSQYRGPISSRTSFSAYPRPCLHANPGRRGERSTVAPPPGQSGPSSPGAHPRQGGARRPNCGSARPPRPPGPHGAAAAGRARGLRAAGPGRVPDPARPGGQGSRLWRRHSPRPPPRWPSASTTLPGGRSGRLRRGSHPLSWGTLLGTTARVHGRAARSNRARRPQGRGAEPSGHADRARGPSSPTRRRGQDGASPPSGAQRPAEPGAEAATFLTTPHPLSRRYLHSCEWLRVGNTVSSAQCGLGMLRVDAAAVSPSCARPILRALLTISL